MSRLSGFTAEALRAIFAQESEDNIFSALTIKYSPSDYDNSAIRIVDNFTHRITPLDTTTCSVTKLSDNTTSTYTFTSNDIFTKSVVNTGSEDDIYYGTITLVNSINALYLFLPYKLTLPSEEVGGIPTAKVVMNDVTRYLTPIIRSIYEPPMITMSMLLYSNPTVKPMELEEFYLSNITYDSGTISADITIESFITEPFPAHSFTPPAFPGAF